MSKIILFLFVIIYIKGTDINIDLTYESLASGTGFTIEDKTLTITQDGTYSISGYSENIDSIIVSSPKATLNFNDVQITSNRAKPPLTISRNSEVILNLYTRNILIGSNQNEKNGVLYMESNSKLTLKCDSSDTGNALVLTPFKGMGIYGEESTNLIIESNLQINPDSQGENIGAIYIGNDIIINEGDILDNILLTQEINPSIKAGGSIIIKKGLFSFHSIQAGNSIILGEKGESSPFDEESEEEEYGEESFGIELYSKFEGIKANTIEIYSGKIELFTEKESISSNGDIIITGGAFLMYSETSSPFKKNGKLKIENAFISSYGQNCIGKGIETNQLAVSYYGKINSGQTITVFSSELGGEIISENVQKGYNYFFYHFPFPKAKYKILIDGKEVSPNNSCDGFGNSSSFLTLSYLFLIIFMILL